jgi:hypothetical protein
MKMISFRIAVGIVISTTVIGVLFPGLSGLMDIVLWPGWIVPELYWGGIHDPLQFLLVFAINVLFYALVSEGVLKVRRKKWG